MPREKFQALTEPMFYILLTLTAERCGMDIMAEIEHLTRGRIKVGPGTLYNLLEQFQSAGFIRQTKVEGRRRSYLLTQKGAAALKEEYDRIQAQAADYRRLMNEEESK